MAKQTKPTTPYDPEAQYDLKVAVPIKVGPFKYLPRQDIVAAGRLLNRIVEEHGADVIRSADPRG